MLSLRTVVSHTVGLAIPTLLLCATAAAQAPPAPEPVQNPEYHEYSVPGAEVYDPALVEAVAKALASRGLYDATIKPAYGLALQSGLRRFQRGARLPASGRIDEATLRALGLGDLVPRLAAGRETATERPGAAPRIPLRFGITRAIESGPARLAWEQAIEIPNATAVRLYFERLVLSGGQVLELRAADDKLVARYPESRGEAFWTEYLSPLPLKLQIVTANGGGPVDVQITRAQARYAEPERSEPERMGAEQQAGAEAIIGSDDSVSIGSYPTGGEIYQKGAAVAALVDGSGDAFCTGFLIGPNRLMTNNHCIATQADCTSSEARFNFQNDASGNPLATTDYACRRLLQTDFTLDFAVVELDGSPGYQWGYLRLTWDNAHRSEDLTIIGHPGGNPKRVSRTNCRVSEPASASPRNGTPATDLSHECDTRPGSSGSPVYDLRRYEVIALHHWGLDGDADNEAVRMRRILAICASCAQPFSEPGKPFDVDGDGRKDAYVRSPDWAGVVRSTPTGFETSWIMGDWVGGWNLGTDNWDLTADVDGNGRSDVVLRSPEWLGVLKASGTGLAFQSIAHDWVGNWNLGFDDSQAVGDFNGDGKDDLVLRSDEWIGLLTSNGASFTNPWLKFDWLGRWNLGRPDRIFVGDFTGDGKDDVFVRSPEWAGLFRSTGTELEEIWMAHDWLGPWNMGDGDEHFVGDFNGDGKKDLLTRSDRWISLWISNGAGFSVPYIQFDRVGSWRLGWQDGHHVADLNGDRKDDVLIRSNEWIGLLISNGSSLSNPWLQFDWLGGWNLGLPDRERVADYTGDGKADVLVRSPEWIGRFVSNGSSLHQDFIRFDWLGGWNLGEVDRLAGGR